MFEGNGTIEGVVPRRHAPRTRSNGQFHALPTARLATPPCAHAKVLLGRCGEEAITSPPSSTRTNTQYQPPHLALKIRAYSSQTNDSTHVAVTFHLYLSRGRDLRDFLTTDFDSMLWSEFILLCS
jgi:hypothetical protein